MKRIFQWAIVIASYAFYGLIIASVALLVGTVIYFKIIEMGLWAWARSALFAIVVVLACTTIFCSVIGFVGWARKGVGID